MKKTVTEAMAHIEDNAMNFDVQRCMWAPLFNEEYDFVAMFSPLHDTSLAFVGTMKSSDP